MIARHKIIGTFTMLFGTLGILMLGVFSYQSIFPKASTSQTDLAPQIELKRHTVFIDKQIPYELKQQKKNDSSHSVSALVYMQKPDKLPSVYALDKTTRNLERSMYVDALKKKTEAIQKQIIKHLSNHISSKDITIRKAYYIDNVFLATITPDGLSALYESPGVTAVVPDKIIAIDPPVIASSSGEWSLTKIQADRVWNELGITGNGVIIANIDTGVQWNHPALKTAYRGWNGSGVDHDYNWYDPTGISPIEPYDNNNHGTHTMGTMVGFDGNKHIGVAPGAKWIAAKGCATNSCAASDLLSAGQWILAPTKIDGSNPDPSKAPDIVNNSWGGPGCDLWYESIITSWIHAGIVPIFSAGNNGPNNGTLGSPGDNPGAINVGATDVSDKIGSFSSRGPTCSSLGTLVKPILSAPGVSVNSSIPVNSYAGFSGTSMAAPHVSGAVALLKSAKFSLTASDIINLLTTTSVDLGSTGNDNSYGSGRIDVYQAALNITNGGSVTGTVLNQTTNTPIANAQIQATLFSNSDRKFYVNTNNDGNYTFTYLSPGTYILSASAFGFISATSGTTIVSQAQKTANIALVPLPRHSLTGRVVDTNNAPLSATISILNTPIPSTQTNGADGSFAISNIPDGTYTISLSAANYTPITEQITITSDTAKMYQLTYLPPPSITVLKPNGGETLEKDETYRITWNATSTVGTVWIGLKNPWGSSQILTYVDSSQGYYDWNVSKYGSLSFDQFRIKISQDVPPFVSDESDNFFTISYPNTPTPTPTLSPTPTPFLQVLQPNGGETLVSGDTYTVLWNSNTSVPVNLSLNTYDENGALIKGYGIATSIPNTGSYDWKIPYQWASKYKLLLHGPAAPQAESKNFFFIVTPTPSPTPTNTPTPSPTPTPTNTPTPSPTPTQAQCTPQCGNGMCDEVTCQGARCPCAETPISCPVDCRTTPTPSPTPNYSVVTIFAAGTAYNGVYPTMELRINGSMVKRFTDIRGYPNLRLFFRYTVTLPKALTSKDTIRVHYINAPNTGAPHPRKLRVDKIMINNVSYQTEDTSTYSTGTWSTTDSSCSDRYAKSEWLHCNGFFQYKL